MGRRIFLPFAAVIRWPLPLQAHTAVFARSAEPRLALGRISLIHGRISLYFKLGALVVLVRRFELWTSSCGVLCTNQLQPLLLLVVAHLLVVCVVGLFCAPLLLPFFFFLFLLRSARISCLSRTVRGGVSQVALLAQCRWPAVWAAWPRLVSTALCDLQDKGCRAVGSFPKVRSLQI